MRKILMSITMVIMMILVTLQPHSKVSAAEVNNIITGVTIKNSSDVEIEDGTNVTQYTDLRVEMEFELPNNQVFGGDITVIKIPNELRFVQLAGFEVLDGTGNLIANATIQGADRTVTLIYTDYVEQKSDIKGKLNFTLRVDASTAVNNETVEIVFDIFGVTIPGIEVNYQFKGDSPNELFSKYAYFADEEGTEIFSNLRINPSAKSYNDVTVYDELKTDGINYKPGSFRILKGIWYLNDSGIYQLGNREDVTNQYTIELNENNTSFSVRFGELAPNDQFRIEYIVETHHESINGEKYTNYAKMVDTETIVRENTVNTIYEGAGGLAEGYNFAIEVMKYDQDQNRLSGAEFKLVRDANGVEVKAVTDSEGRIVFEGLLRDDYTLIETKAPDGYIIVQNEYKISKDQLIPKGVYIIEVINYQDKMFTLSGTKTWVDNQNQDGIRPESIELKLFANGVELENTSPIWIKEGDVWTYTYLNLPEYKDGVAITYTVEEAPVNGYITTIEGLAITNTHVPSTITLEGTKTWVDNNDKNRLRPSSIVLNLYANGVEVENIEADWVTKEGNIWKFKFTDLPQFDNGTEIKYTIVEDFVEFYTPTYDGLSITNTIENKGVLPGTGISTDVLGPMLMVSGLILFGLSLITRRKRIS